MVTSVSNLATYQNTMYQPTAQPGLLPPLNNGPFLRNNLPTTPTRSPNDFPNNKTDYQGIPQRHFASVNSNYPPKNCPLLSTPRGIGEMNNLNKKNVSPLYSPRVPPQHEPNAVVYSHSGNPPRFYPKRMMKGTPRSNLPTLPLGKLRSTSTTQITRHSYPNGQILINNDVINNHKTPVESGQCLTYREDIYNKHKLYNGRDQNLPVLPLNLLSPVRSTDNSFPKRPLEKFIDSIKTRFGLSPPQNKTKPKNEEAPRSPNISGLPNKPVSVKKLDVIKPPLIYPNHQYSIINAESCFNINNSNDLKTKTDSNDIEPCTKTNINKRYQGDNSRLHNTLNKAPLIEYRQNDWNSSDKSSNNDIELCFTDSTTLPPLNSEPVIQSPAIEETEKKLSVASKIKPPKLDLSLLKRDADNAFTDKCTNKTTDNTPLVKPKTNKKKKFIANGQITLLRPNDLTPEKHKSDLNKKVPLNQLDLETYHDTALYDPYKPKKPIKFSWTIARALIKLQMQQAEDFQLNGVPWSSWKFQNVPTLGAYRSSRVQKMYKVVIPSDTPQQRATRLFIKMIPINVWNQQWEYQNQWNGEYVTDGENFVMDAAVLAFLQQYGEDLCPKLVSILELSSGSQNKDSNKFQNNRRKEISHIAIVSELYGIDILEFVRHRVQDDLPLTDFEKLSLQYKCLVLLNRLHELGLAHLDFTPENVLCGKEGLRLCDFAKATPLYTPTLRHTTMKKTNSNIDSHLPFESCQPTVGKGAYMPPECWQVFRKLQCERIYYPLDELAMITTQTERSTYYFSVEAADVYMSGVLLFWIWSKVGVWQYSDINQDQKYYNLIRHGLNFDHFYECRTWPYLLKNMLQSALQPDPKLRNSLNNLLEHGWFEEISSMTTRDRQPCKFHTTVRPQTARTHYQQSHWMP